MQTSNRRCMWITLLQIIVIQVDDLHRVLLHEFISQFIY
ncbi:MPPV-163 variola B22R-like protein [Magpiepox virus 2]|nr:MPPV-163 variola B22R-like protein [Magpiepox virus 2]